VVLYLPIVDDKAFDVIRDNMNDNGLIPLLSDASLHTCIYIRFEKLSGRWSWKTWKIGNLVK
jgi:hypothetical protein